MFSNSKYILPFAVCTALIIGSSTAAWSAEIDDTQLASLPKDVGDVSRARGSVGAIRQDSTRMMQLSEGSNVLFLDTILTGDNSRAEIAFVDDSQLYVGANAELVIDELVFEPNVKSSAHLTLISGAFRMISGQINKVEGGQLTMATPVATIGIRGTDFWGLQTEDTLTMVLIDDGILDISNGVETVTLTEPLTGIVIEHGKPNIQRISITPGELAEAAKTVTW